MSTIASDNSQSDRELAQQHRSHLRTPGGMAAFDAFMAMAGRLAGYRVYPAWHGEIRDVRFDDVVTGERPFAFIVNRSDLLFYVRKPGLNRVPGGLPALQAVLPTAKETNAGEWTVRLTSAEDVENLVQLLFAGAHPQGRRDAWTADEVQAVVDDYIEMLILELNGQSFNKAARARALMPRLRGRSKASIEMKRQNISAALLELHAPWVAGYKPLKNAQLALTEAVAERIKSLELFDSSAISAAERPATVPSTLDFSQWLVQPPELRPVKEPAAKPYVRTAAKRDYVALEAQNRSLGRAGELLIVEYERHRLRELGAKRLSERVEHVAATQGDGLGYDVLSFEASGKERLIEVKTTSLGREAPFFVSRNELRLSKEQPDLFRLCRVFEFRQRPQMFELSGMLDQHCQLDPVSYRASFG